jgi:lycopene cyclase domain-containing protein
VFGQATYLIYLAAWAAPVLVLQWLSAAPELRRRGRPIGLAVGLATLYLAAADRFALGSGIWEISPTRSSGLMLVGLPLEELLFFALTNLMVAQSVALLIAPALTPRVVLARLRAHAARLTELPRAWSSGLAAASGAAVLASAASTALAAPPALSAPAMLVMEATPVPAASWLLGALGEASRPLALLGGLALHLLVGGLIGALVRCGPLGVALGLYASGGWFLLAVGQTHPLGAGLLAAGPLAALTAGPAVGAGDEPEGRPRLGRRALLRLAPPLAAAALVGLWLVDRRRRDAAEAAAPLFAPPVPAPRADGFPVEGQPPEVTPVDAFYVVSKNVEDPAPDAGTWRLRLFGAVERPLTLGLADLRALPRVDLYATLQCVSNPIGGPLMGNGLWSGARLGDLLELARPRDGARWLVARGLDGHFEDQPLDPDLVGAALVAYALDGRLLDRRHGFPARLLVPGRYGFKNVKWLAQVEVTARETPGHWPSRGWSREAPMQTSARVDLVRRRADHLVAAGVAIGGARSISRVEARLVAADGAPGDWVAADLHLPPLGTATWVQWRARLPLPGEGGGRVEARAFDGRGWPQVLAPSPSFPDGATGLHGLVVES